MEIDNEQRMKKLLLIASAEHFSISKTFQQQIDLNSFRIKLNHKLMFISYYFKKNTLIQDEINFINKSS